MAISLLIPVRATEKVRRWVVGEINWRVRGAFRARVKLRETIVFTVPNRDETIC